jgi:nitroimidazol reductase NimA-like FMN-containing flavoprotein (pyridoxamine 5'-phosphate oxidase superfamily)
MPHPPWSDLISSCFQSTEFMALATQGERGLWVNPVYFAWDDKFSLYFISQLDCAHMENIRSTPSVCCTIFPTDRPAGDDVFGAYVKGRAEILSDPEEKRIADHFYYGRVYPNDAEGKQRDKDGYRLDPSWHFVKISLEGLWYFDTRYFAETRTPVPESAWR